MGVYVGVFGLLAHSQSDAKKSEGPSVYDGTANSMAVASGRVSYVLGLTGPCFPVDTACSASLVALHLARKSLDEMAVVVGVSVLDFATHSAFSTAGMLSPLGRCHTFDARADGYSRAEG